MNLIGIAIIEDDTEIREGLGEFIRSQDDMKLISSSGSVEEYMESMESAAQPDIVLMDIGLPGMSGIEGIAEVKKRNQNTEVIMITMYNEAGLIFESLRAGAAGYFLKNTSFEAIREAILSTSVGGAGMSPEIARKVINFFGKTSARNITGLTEKEQEVVRALVDGLSYKLIADRMKISIETVRYHIKNIYRKLQVNSKAEVISKTLRGEI